MTLLLVAEITQNAFSLVTRYTLQHRNRDEQWQRVEVGAELQTAKYRSGPYKG